VGGDLNLYGCKSLRSLPPDLKVNGSLNLRWCESLESIPLNMKIGGNIYVREAGCINQENLNSVYRVID